MTSVLFNPMTLSANALSQELPVLPARFFNPGLLQPVGIADLWLGLVSRTGISFSPFVG
jgi:hypothetical protein